MGGGGGGENRGESKGNHPQGSHNEVRGIKKTALTEWRVRGYSSGESVRIRQTQTRKRKSETRI